MLQGFPYINILKTNHCRGNRKEIFWKYTVSIHTYTYIHTHTYCTKKEAFRERFFFCKCEFFWIRNGKLHFLLQCNVCKTVDPSHSKMLGQIINTQNFGQFSERNILIGLQCKNLFPYKKKIFHEYLVKLLRMGISLKNVFPGILAGPSKLWMAICNHEYLKSEAFWHTSGINKSWAGSVREKCPNTEFFLVRISMYSVWMWENTDQKKLHIWTLLKQWLCKQTKSFNSLSVIL